MIVPGTIVPIPPLSMLKVKGSKGFGCYETVRAGRFRTSAPIPRFGV